MISHKIRGIDGNRKPISFTKAEKLKIQQGRIKLNKYLQNVLKDPAK